MYCKIVIDVVWTTRRINVIMRTDTNIEYVLWESLMAVCIITDIMDMDSDMSIFYYLRLFIYLRIFRYWWIFKYWSGYLNMVCFTLYLFVLPYVVCVPDCQHHSLHLYCRYVWYLNMDWYLNVWRYLNIEKYLNMTGYLNIGEYLNIGCSTVLLLSCLYVDCQHHWDCIGDWH